MTRPWRTASRGMREKRILEGAIRRSPPYPPFSSPRCRLSRRRSGERRNDNDATVWASYSPPQADETHRENHEQDVHEQEVMRMTVSNRGEHSQYEERERNYLASDDQRSE